MEFNATKYMHGYCQYFAIEAAKIFEGKVVLWFDNDEINDRVVLCHAYCEIIPNLYIDALGTFSNVSEREDEFEFNEKNIFTYTIDEAKEELERLSIPFDNEDDINEARDFLKNNMAVLEIGQNKKMTTKVGIYSNSVNFKDIMVASFCEKDCHFSPLIHGINYKELLNNIVSHIGFKPTKSWCSK